MTSKTGWDAGEGPLTFEEMRASLQGEDEGREDQAEGRGYRWGDVILERFPLACPQRASLLDRALSGDSVAWETVVVGATRVAALRRRDLDDTVRHLSGKHDQKSHGKGGGSAGGDGGDGGAGVNIPVTGLDGLPPALDEAYSRVLGEKGDLSQIDIRRAAKKIVSEEIAEAMADVDVRLLVEEAAARGLSEDETVGVDLAAREVNYNKALAPFDGDAPLREQVWVKEEHGVITRTGNQFGMRGPTESGFVRSGSREAEKMVRRDITSGLVDQWAFTSNDDSPRSLAIQRAVEDVFDVQGSTGWHSASPLVASQIGPRYEKYGSVYRSFVTAQYNSTQRFLAENNITSMTVVRGIHGDGSRNIVSGPKTYVHGTYPVRDVEVTTRPISSWSNNVQTAFDFSYDNLAGQTGSVMAATVPASRIFSTPLTGAGCLGEAEVVVLGGEGLSGRLATGRNLSTSDHDLLDELLPQWYTPRERAAAPVTVMSADIDDDHADWITVTAEASGRKSDRQLAAEIPEEEPAPVEETPEPVRHLSGKHDQKTHGKGSGVSGASAYVADGVAAIYGGGATLDPLDGYSSPDTGICVARPAGGTSADGVPNAKIVDAERFFSDPDVLVSFIEERHDTFLTEEGAGEFGQPKVGVWHNESDGKVYLDVTDVVPSNQRDAALELGREQNQISVFDLDNMEEIETGGTGRGRQAEEPGSHRGPSGGLGQQDGGPEARVGAGGHRPDEPPEELRHLAGKHDQKSHAGGRVSAGTDTHTKDKKPVPNSADAPDGSDWNSMSAADKAKAAAAWEKAGLPLDADGMPDIDAMSANLVDTYGIATPQEVAYGEDFYSQAHNDARAIAEMAGVSEMQAAAAISSMSPHTEWESNVVWAHHVAKMVAEDPVVDWDQPVRLDKKDGLTVGNVTVWNGVDVSRVGARLSDFSVRDQSEIIAAMGKRPMTAVVLGGSKAGQTKNVNAVITGNIGKAVTILRGPGTREAISAELGGHKTRSFYNNILTSAKVGTNVTVDTHAFDAAILGPGAQHGTGHTTDAQKAVISNGSHAAAGIHGFGYGPTREAYVQAVDTVNTTRKASGQRPLSPAEFQAVVWMTTLD